MAKRILLADDGISIKKMVNINLADGDYQVVTVDNGNDVLKKAREFSPDYILADVGMPGKSGYEVCEAVKADPSMLHIRVFLLAESNEGFDRDRADQIGADGFILKPFDSRTFIDKLASIECGKDPYSYSTGTGINDEGGR